jgi:two-component system LytT family response regulator
MREGTIRVLIVDDEPLARERISTLLARHADIEIAGECANGRKAVAAIRKDQPDLVFLDVQMPEMDGFDVTEAVGPERMPAIIFVTAYDKYALRAFDTYPLDYLLKPFDRQRFERALDRARQHLSLRRSDDFAKRLMNMLADRDSDRIVIRSGGSITFLRTSEMDWIEGSGNYLRIHAGKDEHLLRETMNQIEDRLDPNHFVRIHRSAIVSIDRIKRIEPLFHGDLQLILQDGTRLTMSRTYRGKLEKILGSTGRLRLP